MLNSRVEIEKLTIKHRRPDLYRLLLKVGAKFIGLKDVRLSDVKVDQGIYPRESTDWDRVEIYAEAMGNGDVFPPILVASDPENLLVDGNHRYNAARRFGAEFAWAEEWDIPRPYIKIIAQAANTEVSNIDIPLSGREKKKAIIEDWQDGIRDIGLIAQALKTTVSYVRKVLSQAGLIKSRKEQIRERAKELKEQGLSYREIAKKLGEEFNENVAIGTLNNWFCSDSYPSKKLNTPTVRSILDDPEKLVEEEEREIASTEDDIPETLKKFDNPKMKAKVIEQIKKVKEKEERKKEPPRIITKEETIQRIKKEMYRQFAEYQVRFCEDHRNNFDPVAMVEFLDEWKRFFLSGEWMKDNDYMNYVAWWRARKINGFKYF
jgi:ParB-like chromosome segregation protein Spo0J